jgi:hypothetical protein
MFSMDSPMDNNKSNIFMFHLVGMGVVVPKNENNEGTAHHTSD